MGRRAGSRRQGTKGIAIGYEAALGTTVNATYVSGNVVDSSLVVNDVSGIEVGMRISGQGYVESIGVDFNVISVDANTNTVALNSAATSQPSGTLTFTNGQGDSAVAIGDQAGMTTQSDHAIAIGNQAGETTQGESAIAIGKLAGQGGAATFSATYVSGGFTDKLLVVDDVTGIVTGMRVVGSGFSGITVQSINAGTNTLTINAFATSQPSGTIAFTTGQGEGSIAIGNEAGKVTQDLTAIAIGLTAAHTNQGKNATAIGTAAGFSDQGENAIAIGLTASSIQQGKHSIAIGAFTGGFANPQAEKSIILNATGASVENTTADSLVIKPIRNASGTHSMEYNPTTGEVTYDTLASGGLPSRSPPIGATSSLADAAQADLDITGFKSYTLMAITTDKAARVRLYVNAATRTADAARAEGIDPTSDAGVIAEVITTGAETVIISPGAIGFNLESSPTTNIPCRVTNKSGSTGTVQVGLTILQLEA